MQEVKEILEDSRVKTLCDKMCELLKISEALIKKGDYEQVICSLEGVAEEWPDFGVLGLLGRAYLLLSKYNVAIEYFDKALDKDKDIFAKYDRIYAIILKHNNIKKRIKYEDYIQDIFSISSLVDNDYYDDLLKMIFEVRSMRLDIEDDIKTENCRIDLLDSIEKNVSDQSKFLKAILEDSKLMNDKTILLGSHLTNRRNEYQHLLQLQEHESREIRALKKLARSSHVSG